MKISFQEYDAYNHNPYASAVTLDLTSYFSQDAICGDCLHDNSVNFQYFFTKLGVHIADKIIFDLKNNDSSVWFLKIGRFEDEINKL